MRKKRNLPRLDPQYYRGETYVFWTHTTKRRARFPEGPLFLASFREGLCHVCARYHLMTPVYCLMPDHLHLLWIGVHPESDQRNATKRFRCILGDQLSPVSLQDQPHDHVVREEERENGVYADTVNYVLQNPVRAGLVEDWRQYSGIGAMVPGYPELDPREPGFRESFWRVHAAMVSKNFAGGRRD